MEVINPFLDLVADLTPTKFEQYCCEVLKGYAKEEKLLDFNIKHNDHIPCYDGTYQIDIHATCTVLKSKIDILVECKKHKRSIERKVVAELKQKIDSIGANKGIIISTSGFQEGAAKFAEKNGIALWQIIDGRVMHIKNSAIKINLVDTLLAKYDFPYYVKKCDESGLPIDPIYPTKEMFEVRNELIRKELNNLTSPKSI